MTVWTGARMGVLRDSEGLNLSNVLVLKVKMMMVMSDMFLGEGEARQGVFSDSK